MAGVITEEMKAFSRQMRWRQIEPREKRERDRSISGKQRVKARKAARRNVV